MIYQRPSARNRSLNSTRNSIQRTSIQKLLIPLPPIAWNYLKDTIHNCALETFGTKSVVIRTGTKQVLRKLNLLKRGNVMPFSNYKLKQNWSSKAREWSTMRQGNAPMRTTQNSQRRFNLPQTQTSEQCTEESTKSFGNKLRKPHPPSQRRVNYSLTTKRN